MAAKPLPSQAFLRECFDYNPETGSLTWKTRPITHFVSESAWKAWNKRYAARRFGSPLMGSSGTRYYLGMLNGKMRTAHRLIFKLFSGNDPIGQVDHWDRDGLNNRWGNLRDATRAQNACNSRDRNGALMRGVSRAGNQFSAQIRINGDGKKHYLGLFKTMEEAHAAYVRAANEWHREFSHYARPSQK